MRITAACSARTSWRAKGADSMQTAAMAIRQGLTVDDLADTIFPI
jgi:hypothetical protein